jgi:hypothetical protein
MNPRRAISVFVVLAAAVGLAGCGGDPVPGPSGSTHSAPATATGESSPSPTAKTPEQVAAEAKQANIEAATQMLVDYYAKASAIANNHYQGWEELQQYWGTPEVIDIKTQGLSQAVQAGRYTTGANRLASLEVTDYLSDDRMPGFERVSFRGCMDSSAVTGFNADGTKIVRDTTKNPNRIYVDYMVQHQGVDGLWTINTEDQHMDQPC